MPSVAYSTDLSNTSLPTLQGSELDITVDPSGAVFVDGARVINTDVLLANGVLHVIDAVLSPDAQDTQPGEDAIPTGPASVVPFTDGVEPETSVYSELSATTSFVAGGLVTAAAATASASMPADASGSMTASMSAEGRTSGSASVSPAQQTGNAGARKEMPYFAAAAAVGAVAFALDL